MVRWGLSCIKSRAGRGAGCPPLPEAAQLLLRGTTDLRLLRPALAHLSLLGHTVSLAACARARLRLAPQVLQAVRAVRAFKGLKDVFRGTKRLSGYLVLKTRKTYKKVVPKNRYSVLPLVFGDHHGETAVTKLRLHAFEGEKRSLKWSKTDKYVTKYGTKHVCPPFFLLSPNP
jgi:hypothetical protein